jgi:hypothetical protein
MGIETLRTAIASRRGFATEGHKIFVPEPHVDRVIGRQSDNRPDCCRIRRIGTRHDGTRCCATGHGLELYAEMSAVDDRIVDQLVARGRLLPQTRYVR